MTELELELKKLIVSALFLEHIKPEDIDTDAPLFGEGLGLDSIDALELAIAIEQAFGVRIKADDEGTCALFASVKTLAAHIAQNRP